MAAAKKKNNNGNGNNGGEYRIKHEDPELREIINERIDQVIREARFRSRVHSGFAISSTARLILVEKIMSRSQAMTDDSLKSEMMRSTIAAFLTGYQYGFDAGMGEVHRRSRGGRKYFPK